MTNNVTASAPEEAQLDPKEVALNNYLLEQLREEFGDEEQPAHKQNHRTFMGHRTHDAGCLACRFADEKQMLSMKHGVTPVQLTDKERKVAARDERRRTAVTQ